jgi:hypothetical protein
MSGRKYIRETAVASSEASWVAAYARSLSDQSVMTSESTISIGGTRRNAYAITQSDPAATGRPASAKLTVA